MRIRPLEQLTLVQRIWLTIVIVLVILFAMALFGYISGRWDHAEAETAKEPQLYQGVPLDAKLLELDKRALDEAYHAQILKLFGIWLGEGAREATFFQNGLRNARRAYNQAAQQIARREHELEQSKERKP